MSAITTRIPKKKVHQRRYGIDLVKSYRYLEYFRDHYNDQVTDKKQCLKNEFLLAKELVRLYRQEFMRWQEGEYFNVEISLDKLPLLAVNNQFLARIMCKTDRTIQNYRRKLVEASILIPVGQNEAGESEHSVFHGRTCDYELMLNPKLLHISSNLHTLRVAVQGIDDFYDITKNFRPTSTSTCTSTLTRTNLEQLAEKNANENISVTPEPSEGTKQEPLPEAPEHEGQNGQSSQPPVHAQPEQEIPAAESAPSAIEEEAIFRRQCIIEAYARTLLNSARTYIYPSEHFDQARKDKVCRRIEELFGDASEDNLLKILNNYQCRLKLTQLYFAKEFGVLPEIEDFFDKENPDGFRATRVFAQDKEKYPLPSRKTFRLAKKFGRGRGDGRSGNTSLSDVIFNA